MSKLEQLIHQKKYFCIYCEGSMEAKVSTLPNGKEHVLAQCSNEDCDAFGIGWDINTLNANELNQAQRLMEILEDD